MAPNFDPQNLQNHCFSFFQKIVVRSWDRFRMPFGFQLGCILLPKSIKILLKSTPRKRSKIDRFWLRFLNDLGSVLGTKLEPCWSLFSLQDGPRGFQDAPKTPPRKFQDAPKDTKTPSRGPKGPQDASKIDFGLIFAWIFGVCLIEF